MLFSSLEFLYVFLPLGLGLYFLFPMRWRNGVLLGLSLLFYAYGEPRFALLMAMTIAANYLFGRLLCRVKRRRAVLSLAVAVNLSLLFFFKYAGAVFPALGEIPLPVGISFYTFQTLSYVVDVHRGRVEASRDPVGFGAYVTMFPQLIAGPIVRYDEVEVALRERRASAERIASGISLFCVGLAKKVLLANPAGEMAEELLLGASSFLGAWLWLLFFAFQIYFDFSGYSDMAVGLGRILGFEFPQNFCYPYLSRSITEFWRRWHITLSSFFREYVYVPLGGNRRGRWRTYLNLLIVWALTGLWHGASLNFLLWGLYFFLILVMEKAFLLRVLDRIPALLRHGYALFFILLGWLIFASDGTRDTLSLLPFLFGGAPLLDGWSLYALRRSMVLLGLMTLGATPFGRWLWERFRGRFPGVCVALRIPLCLGALILSTAYLVDSGYNPFLYFRF